MNVLTEAEVRALHGRVYCCQSTDTWWEKVRGKWMSASGIEFLLAHDFPVEDAWKHYDSWAKAQPILKRK